MKIRLFKSIDGFFRSNLKYKIIDNFKDINFKKISLIGKGNSISGLPYSKKSTLLKINTKKKILLDKRKKIIEVSGNYEAYNVHNFLLKNDFFPFGLAIMLQRLGMFLARAPPLGVVTLFSWTMYFS